MWLVEYIADHGNGQMEFEYEETCIKIADEGLNIYSYSFTLLATLEGA